MHIEIYSSVWRYLVEAFNVFRIFGEEQSGDDGAPVGLVAEHRREAGMVVLHVRKLFCKVIVMNIFKTD
jgi:hypothetical protein